MTTSGSRPGRRDARRAAGRDRGDGYAELSRTPLHSVLFILPVIAAFEVGFAVSGAIEDIRARHVMSLLFDRFGAPAVYAAPAFIVLVLLAMHAVQRERWRVRPAVLGGMALESVAVALPLFVLGQVAALLGAGGGVAAAGGGTGAEPGTPWHTDLAGDIARACGAGLYEEFVFRLVGVAAIHLLLSQLIGVPKRIATIAAVVATAVAFALHHDLRAADGSWLVGRGVFLFVAGIYFGAIYALRGFGVAVGVHAVYDVLAFQTQG